MPQRALAALALVSGLLAGCGRLGFESATDAGTDGAVDAAFVDTGLDAGTDAGTDAASFDTGIDAPAIDSGMDAGSDGGIDGGIDGGSDAGMDSGTPDAGTVLGPFPTPTMIAELASGMATDDPTLTADRLELFFNRSNDIYVTTRATTTSAWATATAVAELNTASTETSPEVSGDGLTIYFASQRGGNLDIWVATRASRSAAFGTPTAVTELDTTMFESNATPRTDALEITLSRGAGSGSRDIYHATRLSTALPFGPPVLVAELSTTSNDGAAMLAVAGQVIVFFSNRGGNSDLYFATRVSELLPFTGIVPLTDVNTAGNEEDPWISEDGHHLVFARDGQLFETSR